MARPGARTVDGRPEYGYNLALAGRLAHVLAQRGLRVERNAAYEQSLACARRIGTELRGAARQSARSDAALTGANGLPAAPGRAHNATAVDCQE